MFYRKAESRERTEPVIRKRSRATAGREKQDQRKAKKTIRRAKASDTDQETKAPELKRPEQTRETKINKLRGHKPQTRQ